MHSKNQKRHSSPGPSRIPLVPMKPKAPAAPGPGSGETLAFRVPKDYPQSRFNKAPLAVYPPKGARNKTCVSLPIVTLEKIPCLSRVDGTSRVRLTSSSSSSPSSLRPPPSSSSSPLTPPTSASSHPHRSGEKLVNGRGGGGVFGGVPSSSVPRSVTPPSAQDRRPSPARSPLDRRPPSTPSTASPLDRGPPPSPSSSQRAGATPSCLQLPMPASLSSSNSGSLLDRKQQNGVKASSSSSLSSSRSHKRLSGRVFDPDKHCGVQDPESKRPCTRSLTCKTHSLTHRRAVPGRTKHFDILLAEHKGRAKEKDASKEKEKEDATQQQARKDCGSSSNSSTAAMMSQETTSPSKPHCPNGRPLSTLKLRLANAHIPRVPGLISSSAALPAAPPAPAPASSSSSSNPEPSPHGWGKTAGDTSRLSSDDGDVETSDDAAADRPACHFSSHHPRPLACCVFSSRLMGRGHYVFDRRWDRMRLALQSMVERHLNAQMWRKVPLAAESLLSLSSSPSPYANSLTPPPPLLPSPSEPFPSFSSSHAQSASSAGALASRGPPAPVVSAAGKPRNGTANAPKPGRPAREREDSVPSAKKRRSSAVHAPSPSLSSSSSSFSSSSSSSPTVDGHKRNGGGCHPALLQGRGGSAAGQGRRKGPGRGGSYPGSRGEDWLSRTDGGQCISTQNSLEHPTATSIPHSPSKDQTISTQHPSGPLAYVGEGGVDGKKRRSPSSYGGKSSKLSRVGGLESLLRKGNGTGSILASGPDSPRQAKLHH